MSSKEKATPEKLRVAELRTEASFMKKKREAELQAESLRLEEEMTKAEARVKIYEQEKLEAKVQSEKLVVTEESGKTRKCTWDGPLLTEQRDQRKNYVILRDRHRRDKKTDNKEGIEMTTQSALNIGNQNEMINQSYHDAGIPPICTDGIERMLCKLIKEQSAPDAGIEEFDGNPLNFNYFRSMFRETVEKKINDPQGRLTRLIKYTCGEARELVKNFIHDRPDVGYTNAMNLLEKQYGDPHRLLASYRREIKQMSKIKSGDAVAFRRLFNFLIKCQTMSYGTSKNPLDSPDVICMILSKVPRHLQDKLKRNALRIRKTETREPGLLDLTNFIEDEMILVNDLLFSREAAGQYDQKTPRPQKIHKHQSIHTYTITKDAADKREVTQAKTGTCPVCEKGHQDIEDYPTFLTQPVQDRSKTVFKKKLCYGCLPALSKDHNARKGSNRRSYKV